MTGTPLTATAGARLPPLPILVTPALIVASAIATSDFERVHHDHAWVQSLGMPDIYMTIHVTNGFVARYVGDWAGPAARLRAVRLKLGTPAFPGDTLTLTGEVLRAEDAAGERRLEIDVRGRTARGEHVGAVVEVSVPLGAQS